MFNKKEYIKLDFVEAFIRNIRIMIHFNAYRSLFINIILNLDLKIILKFLKPITIYDQVFFK
jgi:hypothetical protein